MGKHFERDLAALQQDILAMSATVEKAISQAVLSLQERDATAAQSVIDGDAEIDSQENQIEEECLKMLALHQPVAADLRRVAAVLKINTDLERMGDLASSIAQRALHVAEVAPLLVPAKLQNMMALTVHMVRQALEAFYTVDAWRAREVCRLDDEVDRYNEDVIAELIQNMQQVPEAVQPGLSLFSATRNLERIADHATNIAEEVIYLAEGEIVRHRPEAIRRGNDSAEVWSTAQEAS